MYNNKDVLNMDGYARSLSFWSSFELDKKYLGYDSISPVKMVSQVDGSLTTRMFLTAVKQGSRDCFHILRWVFLGGFFFSLISFIGQILVIDRRPTRMIPNLIISFHAMVSHFSGC